MKIIKKPILAEYGYKSESDFKLEAYLDDMMDFNMFQNRRENELLKIIKLQKKVIERFEILDDSCTKIIKRYEKANH